MVAALFTACKCVVVSLMHRELIRGSFTPTQLLQRDVAPDINYVIKFSHTADRNIIRSKRSLLLHTLGCPACLLM